MPQDPKHVVEAQKQRIKIKEKSRNYIAGTVNLQVIGSGAAAAPATVYLFTDQSRSVRTYYSNHSVCCFIFK